MWGISLVLIGVLSLLHVPQSIVQLELMFQQYLPMLREANAQPEVIQFLQNMIGKLDAHETLLNNIAMISSYFEIVLSILLGLFGNRIYYRFVLRRVHKLVQEDVSRKCGASGCGRKAAQTAGSSWALSASRWALP